MKKRKHAYLIMAHNEFEVLKKLIIILDDKRNDIYIHIDRKVTNFNKRDYESLVTHSNIYFVNRIKVTWGGDSIIKCELLLLEEAYKVGYEYYHLLSGVDFPIKNQDYIHEFFDNNSFNYLSIDNEDIGNDYAMRRVKEYYFFQNLTGRNEDKLSLILKKFQLAFIKFQKFLNINRINKNNIKYYKGSNWFSLKHETVSYILNNKSFIKKYFFKGICADEMFLQTLLYNSPYRKRIINDDLRYIDWSRGNPYVFDKSDFDKLIASKDLFARKFTSSNGVTDLLFDYLKDKK